MFTPFFVSFLTLKINSFIERKCFEWESNGMIDKIMNLSQKEFNQI